MIQTPFKMIILISFEEEIFITHTEGGDGIGDPSKSRELKESYRRVRKLRSKCFKTRLKA